MPETPVLFYREDDGRIPVLDWLRTLPPKARAKCIARIELLRELGWEMERPEAAYLDDDIYDLRARFQSVHYRLLYFFHGQAAAVISHGITKTDVIPPREIKQAVARRTVYLKDPTPHGHEPQDDLDEEIREAIRLAKERKRKVETNPPRHVHPEG